MPSPGSAARAPLLWLLLPFLAGLVAGQLWPQLPGSPRSFALTGALLSLAATALAWWRPSAPRWPWATLLVSGVMLTGLAAMRAQAPAPASADAVPREINVTVEVTQVFAAAPKSKTLAGLGRVISTGAPAPALAGQLVYFSAIRKVSVPPLRSGRYAVRGLLQPLPPDRDSADFNDYLANLGVRQRLMRAQIIREVRPPGALPRFYAAAAERLEQILAHGLERHPELLSVYLGMTLGEKAVLSTEQQNAFMRSGTFHIFSVSGLHVAAIALALLGLLRLARLPERAAVVVGLPVLWLYVQITGGSAPAVRAFLMIAFLSAARVFRLPGNSLAALAGAALLTLLLDPRQLFSTGFQMSYAVVAALVLMGAPLADKWLDAWRPFASLPKVSWQRWQRWTEAGGRKFLAALAASWVAFLASTPSGIGYFELFSPGSLVANLLVIPLSSLALGAGFLSLLAGLCGLLPLSLLLNRAAALLILGMDWLVRHGTALPGAYFPATFRAAWLAPAGLAVLLALMLYGRHVRWAPARGGFWPPVVFVGLLLIFGVKFG
ncbi:MAG: ComEC/Rec2 family competence protein [Opitutae bacterium]|nr:ComEC/Rec2 family competence protein [Opitutae bacterium]